MLRGFSEEARTRGFPSPPFGGFGFFVATTKYITKLPDCLIANRIGIYVSSGNVRFGSLADPYDPTALTSAFERIAAIEHPKSGFH